MKIIFRFLLVFLFIGPLSVFSATTGTPSNTVIFTATNPAPTISSISPNNADSGGVGFTLTVIGTNFVSGSQVKFNNQNRPTNFVSSTQVVAQINSTDINNAGFYDVVVSNPSPGGGVSNSISFSVLESEVLPKEIDVLPTENPNDNIDNGLQLVLNSADKVAVAIEKSITNAVKNIKSSEAISNIFENTKKIVQTPVGSTLVKTITATGIIASAIVATPSFSIAEIFLIPLRLWGLLMSLMGIRKKNLPWGVVYDSVTKRPLDPAYVTLKNSRGKEISSAITDIDGRYGFLMPPGVYYIEAKKTNYAFPSKKIGSFGDEVYSSLYFGEKIEVESGQVIKKNIPLDPVNFDWNEFAKKGKNFMKFYSMWDIIIRKISNAAFIIGLSMSILMLFLVPRPYNAVIFCLYIVLIVFRGIMKIFGLGPKSSGYIKDKATGTPLSFAIVRVVSPTTNVEVSTKVADKYGRYYCLVPRGKYYVKIEKKNDDGSYTLIHTSPVIDASKKGIINQMFTI